jgi:hypothetical protein
MELKVEKNFILYICAVHFRSGAEKLQLKNGFIQKSFFFRLSIFCARKSNRPYMYGQKKD